jgi:hypothetical protein
MRHGNCICYVSGGDMAKKTTGEPPGEEGEAPAKALAMAILDIVSAVPLSTEPKSPLPLERARMIQTTAALKTAAVSGTLALPPGPLGIAAIVPDLLAVWRIQAQMVADIAGAFGKTGTLAQEHMIYCLFRHAAAQVVRDLAARVGERVVFRQATLRLLQGTAQRLGVTVSQRVIAKSVARWIPILGSLGVAGYAYYDTAQVGATAVELFQQEFETDAADEDAPDPDA